MGLLWLVLTGLGRRRRRRRRDGFCIDISMMDVVIFVGTPKKGISIIIRCRYI